MRSWLRSPRQLCAMAPGANARTATRAAATSRRVRIVRWLMLVVTRPAPARHARGVGSVATRLLAAAAAGAVVAAGARMPVAAATVVRARRGLRARGDGRGRFGLDDDRARRSRLVGGSGRG